MATNLLGALVRIREPIQKQRVALSNRINALDTVGGDEYNPLLEWMDEYERIEKKIDCEIIEVAKEIPVIQSMQGVKGIGWILSARLVGCIDITKASTFCSLWKYAGYGVKDGKSDRLVKGEKISYNPYLKSVCRLIGVSFLRSKSEYKEIYDNQKYYYINNRPEWNDGHIHAASLRYMMKEFLAHLWYVWGFLDGTIEKQKMRSYFCPENYGWKSLH